jgi:hypothetical protein
MSTSLRSVLMLAFALSLAACSAPASDSALGTESVPASAASESGVVFADPVLEAMVRGQIGKPEGVISFAEAEQVAVLKLDIPWQKEIPEETQIKDLSGIEYFVNLEQLSFNFHGVSDLAPLSGLTHLKGVAFGGNPVTDLSPITGLTQLDGLIMFSSPVTDYSWLPGFTNLSTFMISYTSFSDLSLVSGMTNLRTLYIDNTQVTDVSPIGGMANLKSLKLAGSPIADLSPLAPIYANLTEKDFELP